MDEKIHFNGGVVNTDCGAAVDWMLSCLRMDGFKEYHIRLGILNNKLLKNNGERGKLGLYALFNLKLWHIKQKKYKFDKT